MSRRCKERFWLGFCFQRKGLERVLVLEAVDGSDGFAFVKLRVSGSLFHLLHPRQLFGNLILICDVKSAWYTIRVVFLFVRFLIRLSANRVVESFDCKVEMCSCH